MYTDNLDITRRRNTWSMTFALLTLWRQPFWKFLLAGRRFLHFYDTEKRLLRNKLSSGDFKQHYIINHFDLLRTIRFVCAYKTEPNSNRPQHFISNDQEEGKTKNKQTKKKKQKKQTNKKKKKKQYRNRTWSKDTYLYRQLFPRITIVSRFSKEKRLRSRKIALRTFVTFW